MKLADIITVLGIIVAMASAIFAYFQARAAKRSLHQAYLAKFFGSLDTASQNTIVNPELLYSVHGLNRDVPIEEARNIAYLSMLLDSFQHFYGEQYQGDYTKMVTDMRTRSTFLNRILTVEENIHRWQTLRDIYYGDFDGGFIAAIDSLISDGKQRIATAERGGAANRS